MKRLQRFSISCAINKSNDPNASLLLVLLIAVAGIFSSCLKEFSCEGCNEVNKPPIAIAGADQIINIPTDTTLLDGSASTDPDGKINGWQWQKISGPSSFVIDDASRDKTVVRNLVAGTYHFELSVTDDKGASTRDTVIITVGTTTTTNNPPVANAGSDQTIAVATGTGILDGSGSTDVDNNITSYTWTKISGPSSFDIANSNTVQTQAADLVEGLYLFELTVMDAEGLSDKDTVQIIVMKQRVKCTDCKIVFVSDRDGNSEIYSSNDDGSDIRRLTNDPAWDEHPAWSPDGTRIAFVSDRSGNPEIYVMNSDGSNVVQRTFAGTSCTNPTWSPDGTNIAYGSFNNGDVNIWSVGAMSGSPSLLMEELGFDGQPSWSPDGLRLVFVTDREAYDFVTDIYMFFTTGVAAVTPVTGIIDDFEDYHHPSWSPDAQKLAVAITERMGGDNFKTDIGIMNADGSNLNTIASGSVEWTRTSWTADGTKILYTSLSALEERLDVSWVSSDGTAKGTIITNGWNADSQH